MDHILVEGFPLGDCVNGAGSVLGTSTNIGLCREHTQRIINRNIAEGQREEEGGDMFF